MKNLLKKELMLTLHPTMPLFLVFAAMLLIPNYPYLMSFFYTGLAVFFLCLNGRENRDIPFTMLLPAAKRDIVRTRFAVVILQQLLQLLLTVPFAVLRQMLYAEDNAAGMDANIVLFGCALILYGGFNLIFFTGYYKDVSKIGTPFLLSSVWMFAWICAAEAGTYVIPFVRDRLDTADPNCLSQKIPVLLFGAVVYIVLTTAAYRRSVFLFEKQDI